MTEEPFSTHVMYSLVLLMMCRVSGLIAAGSFSSAWIKGISSPVSRFLIITLARISCFKKTHKFTFCVRKVREAVTKQMRGAGGRRRLSLHPSALCQSRNVDAGGPEFVLHSGRTTVRPHFPTKGQQELLDSSTF